MLENSLYVRCLLLDFSKAFDTVDHLILLHKLRTYHLPPNILSWIVSFLTEHSVLKLMVLYLPWKIFIEVLCKVLPLGQTHSLYM